MPSETAAFATRIPIAPRPMIPSVLPLISGPANCDLPFSTSLPTWSPSFLSEGTHASASASFLDERRRPAITSSLTAFAFAPGVLNTQIPCSAHFSTGMLFTPAPALAIARRFEPNSMSCIAAERTIIASGLACVSATVYFALSKTSVPHEAILFNV